MTPQCMGRGCEEDSRFVVRSLNENDALHENPLFLCLDHVRHPDDIDPFRYLTDGRVSADG